MSRADLERAIATALELSDAGIEPTRHNVGELCRDIDPATLDEAIVGVLHMHDWIVDDEQKRHREALETIKRRYAEYFGT